MIETKEFIDYQSCKCKENISFPLTTGFTIGGARELSAKAPVLLNLLCDL